MSMTTLPSLNTSRLLLRPIAVSDASALHPAMSDPIAMQFWRDPPHESIQTTRRMLDGMLAANRAHWAILERGTDSAIGFVGFHSERPPHSFGYFLDRRYWRRGYMSEAARAVLKFGFDTLGYRQAEAWIHEENEPSLALARKIGFRKVGQTSRRRMHHSNALHRYLIYGLWAHEFFGSATTVPEGLGCDEVEPTLDVFDVERSIRFYTEKLGFTVAFTYGDPPVYAAVKSSPWSAGARIRLRRVEPGQTVTRPAEVIMTLDEVEDYHRRIAPLGITTALETEPWGAREFALEDPDGHKLRFMGW
jgi:ribosomal-protein-alanine N-acetyltransferase